MRKIIRHKKNTEKNAGDKLNIWTKSLIDGSFWFGDEKLNKAKKIIIKDPSDKNIKTINILELSHKDKLNKSEEVLTLKDLNILHSLDESKTPQGYIRLFLEEVDVNTLFLKHNITLKYLSIAGNNFIKSFILGNEGKEIDCYSLGENDFIMIKKDNNSIIKIILQEKNGKQEVLTIVNGIVLN